MVMENPRLFSGYRRVDSFGPDEGYELRSDGEVEEEEVYVTLDLGAVEPTLVPSSSEYRLVGLDTPTPYLQLSGTIFKGQHQSLLGTELLFTESKDDPIDRNKKSLVNVGTTETRIRFCEVELKPKSDANAETLTVSGHTAQRATSQPFLETTQATSSNRSRDKKRGPKGKGKQKASDGTKVNTSDSVPEANRLLSQQPSVAKENDQDVQAGDQSHPPDAAAATSAVGSDIERMDIDMS